MDKQGIKYITGIIGSSDGFEHNPLLHEAGRGGDVVLYEKSQLVKLEMSSADQWLLKPTTLANDIGDGEDVFQHLPISLRTTRLSESRQQANGTYRTTTAPIIPISINVGDYVRVLWDQDSNDVPDTSLEMVVKIFRGPESMTMMTEDGEKFGIKTDGSLNKLPTAGLSINESGFVDLLLFNPSEQPIDIDLIAVGLARTP